jgi:hypothetical protein
MKKVNSLKKMSRSKNTSDNKVRSKKTSIFDENKNFSFDSEDILEDKKEEESFNDDILCFDGEENEVTESDLIFNQRS